MHYRPRLDDLRHLASSGSVLLGVFAAAVLWMMFGPYVLFPPAGYLDPWFYPGYFTNFSYLLHQNGYTYYVSRLPWIVPGLLAFAVASPQVASLMLCAAMIAASATSLYWAVRWHYGHAPAVIAAVALATNPYFMSTASWHYPDGPVIAYAMVGMALYLRPHGNRTLNSVLAAAALALAGFTNYAAAPMILSLFVIPLWRNRHSLQALVHEAICVVCGGTASALAMLIVSKSLIGDSLFFMPQIRMAMYIRQSPGYLEHMWGTGLGFLPVAFRLSLPAFLLAFGLVLLIAIRKPVGPAWAAYLAAVACLTYYALDLFVLHGVLLRVSYHSSYMVVPLFSFVGAATGELWKRGREGAVTAAALVAVGMVLPLALNRLRFTYVPTRGGWMTLASLAAAGIILAILAAWPRLPLRSATIAVLLVAVFLGPDFDESLEYVWAQPKILHGSNLSIGKNADVYRCLMDLENYLKTHIDPRRRTGFWYDKDEPMSNVFDSAAAMNLSGSGNYGRALTTESKAQVESLFPLSLTLVHLTTHAERIPQRIGLLVSRGVALGPERRTGMQFQDKRFVVSLQDVTDLSKVH